MDKPELDALLSRVEAASALNAGMLHQISEDLRPLFPNAPAHPEALSDPTEGVLMLIDRCLPGWSIHLSGQAHAPNGHWRCTLRDSDGQDNDEVIGTAEGRTVPLALLQALLRVAVQRVG